MIEQRIIKYLSEKVAFTSVNEPSKEKKEELGGKWINLSVVQKYTVNYVHFATFKLFIYAPTIYDCALLAEQIEEALEHITELDNIQDCDINDVKEDIDIVKKRPRYSCEVDFCYFN